MNFASSDILSLQPGCIRFQPLAGLSVESPRARLWLCLGYSEFQAAAASVYPSVYPQAAREAPTIHSLQGSKTRLREPAGLSEGEGDRTSNPRPSAWQTGRGVGPDPAW